MLRRALWSAAVRVEPRSGTCDAGDACVLVAIIGARWLGTIQTPALWANISVAEVAAFDERYNIRLHQTHGARSRVPRVPALRVYRDSARRW